MAGLKWSHKKKMMMSVRNVTNSQVIRIVIPYVPSIEL